MPDSILARLSPSLGLPSPLLSPLQSQVDGLVEGFIQQATDLKSLAALSAGGLAYRAGGIGILGWAKGALGQALSVGAGLAAEVSTFAMTQKTLNSVGTTLWKWCGPNGLKQGILSSLVTFSTLKGFGKIAQGQNLIVQHGLQDLALVLGHQLLHGVGRGPKPEGTLAEQLVHAEAVNWQIKGGMSLVHGALPRLGAMEKSLDLSPPAKEPNLPSQEEFSFAFPLAPAIEGRGHWTSFPDESVKKSDHLSLSSQEEGGGGRRRRSRRLVDPQAGIRKIRERPLYTKQTPKNR